MPTTERERVHSYLLSKGYDYEYTTWIVDHGRNTMLYAFANLNSAVQQLGHSILKAFNEAFHRTRA
jgi:hypothetical protein